MSSYESKQKTAGGESSPFRNSPPVTRARPSSRAAWIVVALGALGIFWLRQRRLPDAPPPPAASVKAPLAAPLPTTARAPSPESASGLPPDAPDPYGMPPPSPDQIREPPAPHPVTPEEHHQTQQAARELVENGIARLTSEGRKAAQSGDTETAHRNELRVARLRKRLAALSVAPTP